jgi:hypothetical protein
MPDVQTKIVHQQHRAVPLVLSAETWVVLLMNRKDRHRPHHDRLGATSNSSTASLFTPKVVAPLWLVTRVPHGTADSNATGTAGFFIKSCFSRTHYFFVTFLFES